MAESMDAMSARYIYIVMDAISFRLRKKKDRWYKVYVYVDVEDLRDDEDKKEAEFRIGWIPEAEVGKI